MAMNISEVIEEVEALRIKQGRELAEQARADERLAGEKAVIETFESVFEPALAKLYQSTTPAESIRKKRYNAFRTFQQWALENNLNPLPAKGALVAAFLVIQHQQGTKLPKLKRLATAVEFVHDMG